MLDRDIRRALRSVAPYRRQLTIVLALSLVGTAISLYLPYLSKTLVDRALLGRDGGALIRIVLAFAGLTLGSFALNVVSGLLYTRASAGILFDMRLALFRHLQRLSPRFYARVPLGQIASRINGDISEIQRVAAEVALGWVGSVLFLGGSFVILVALDPVLCLVSVLLLPPALWALVRYRRQLESAIASLRDRSADIGAYLVESLQAMKLIVSLNAQEREARRFRDRNDAFVDSLMRMRRLTYLSGGLPALLIAAGSAVVFLVGGWRVIAGQITMGTLVAFIAYQMRLVGPIQSLMGLYASIAAARVSLRRVHEILDTPPDVDDASASIALRTVRGEIRLEDVSFTFDRGVVLDAVTVTIRPGECVALVGPTGVGKSTIADLLARHLDPQRGRVRLDGHDVRDLRLADLRRHVVVVDQDAFVFHASIGENIRYARPDASDADVLAAARAAGLSEMLERFPEGPRTIVGERGRALSAGERQRLALARALLADPAVLVLDEATGALDPTTESEVVAGYETVMRGRTTILITHRLDIARRADRVVVLREGRVVEDGSPGPLLTHDSAFRVLFVPPVTSQPPRPAQPVA